MGGREGGIVKVGDEHAVIEAGRIKSTSCQTITLDTKVLLIVICV